METEIHRGAVIDKCFFFQTPTNSSSRIQAWGSLSGQDNRSITQRTVLHSGFCLVLCPLLFAFIVLIVLFTKTFTPARLRFLAEQRKVTPATTLRLWKVVRIAPCYHDRRLAHGVLSKEKFGDGGCDISNATIAKHLSSFPVNSA